MSVEEGADGAPRVRPDRVEKPFGPVQVGKGVHQQRFASVGDETRVGQAPAAVGLEVDEEPVAELVKPLAVCHPAE